VNINQKTIKKKLVLEGIGLHSGTLVKIALIPSEENTGIVFLRTDLKKKAIIKACWENIVPVSLCTKISNKDGASVSTIEHLMFSFYALGITNLLIEINGSEVPIMDGSSKIFIDEILKNGLLNQKSKVSLLIIKKTFEVGDKNRFIRYEPAQTSSLEIDYTLEYKDQFIKKQNFRSKDVRKNVLDIAHTRTFCHQEDLEKIFAMGLAKGGSLDNAIIISGNKILNQGGLRCENEFVKHKTLDCLGDLYLSNYFINGKITCNQGGHELTASLLKKIFNDKKNYTIKNSDLSIDFKEKSFNSKEIQAVV
jgi:UDP-3-O-[3-hydroxymyristoyl] N-acetylglucosamine deacetylase